MANSDKRIIYTNDEGECVIMTPADKCDLTVEQIQAKDVPSGKVSTIINKTDLPTDMAFRNAWTFTP
tara:strand:+ start:107 stop:307 length:201 start_codon:yes stop_codon:yes gene_type:complete